MEDRPIILFDGVCNLCNAVVQYVIRHDPGAIFRFAALQGETGQRLLMKHGLKQSHFDSFVLIDRQKIYTKSTAALKVASLLSGPVKLLRGFIFVPRIIRDAVYNVVARKRYKWFGTRESCIVPTPALQARFLK